MTADHVKQAVSAVLTTLTLVYTPAGAVVNAAGGQAEIVAAVVAVYTVVHGIIQFLHGAVTGK